MIGDPLYTPTPEQIRRECERIRAEWTPEIERLRTFPLYRNETPTIQGESRGHCVNLPEGPERG